MTVEQGPTEHRNIDSDNEKFNVKRSMLCTGLLL